MKTTVADFKLFKTSFLDWQVRLGLTQYEAYFEHVQLDGKYAEIDINQIGKVVTARLSKEIGDVLSYPASDAKHEAVHLLLSRLSWLGQARYIENQDLEEEEEAIVMRLMHVL